MRVVRWGAAAAMVAIAVAGCSNTTECGEYPLDDDQRRCVVETVDEMVIETYPFADYKGVDLEEFSNQLWGVLDDSDEYDDQEFLTEVNQAITMLQDGHTRMERQRLQEPAVAPVGLRETADGVVIDRTADGADPSLIGRRVESVDGRHIADVLDDADGWTETGVDGEAALSGTRLALSGEAGTTTELTLDGGEVVELQRSALFDEPQVDRFNGNIGYIRLDTFGFIDDLERVDDALNQIDDTDGLMIDLRDNGGGFPSVSEGFFGRLIDDQQGAFEMVDVDGELHRELPMTPRGDTYDGDVVVLVNNRTYSASNFFTHRMVYHDRGVLVGESTGGGAASPSRGAMLLPGVWFQVSTHVVRAPDGEHAESGLVPEIEVDVDEEITDDGDDSTRVLGVTGDPVKDRAIDYLEGLQ